ncbi:MAG TPA: GTPase ObgE [Leptospiraceae bacterium]|nr:GTPase ObgE [Leptospiraceae bacterium]
MSKFIDEVIIQLKAGDGGPGAISFRHEKFVEFGGPDGGDGGKGGDLYLISDSAVQTLDKYIPLKVYKASSGVHGGARNSSGANSDDLFLKVPVGTQVIDEDTEEILHDFLKDEERFCVVKGGRGGKGNAFFKSSTHQTPRFAQPGEEGEMRKIRLSLKLLADIGIVGLPNAGKSTLLSKITHAHPKIAGYAFTTLIPNLGVVTRPDESRYTIADIPGIIEGASQGHGLGLSFLKHIERVKGILYLFDGSSVDIESEFKMLQNELKTYNKALLKKPSIIVLNKIDIWEDEKFTKELVKRYSKLGTVIPISAQNEINLNKLLETIDTKLIKKIDKKKPRAKKVVISSDEP